MNKADIQGNQNIVIQAVTDSTLTINVNGELKEVKNDLAEIKKMMQSLQNQHIQYADKIYNIDDINEANFGTIIKDAKNALVNSSITAGGNVHIGDSTTHIYHNNNENTEDSNKKSKWLQIGAAIVAVISLIAGIAQISGYSLKDLFAKEEKKIPLVQPTAQPIKKDTIQIAPIPKVETKEIKQPIPLKTKTSTPQNHFEAHDHSKQINIPDNEGTINITQ